MTSRFTRWLVPAISVAWVLIAPVHAEDVKVAAKDKSATPVDPATAAQRVSPYAKYARAHAEAQQDHGPTYPKVSGLLRRPHHAAPARTSN